MSSFIPSKVSAMPLIDPYHDKSDVVANSMHYSTCQDQQSFHQITKLSSWEPNNNHNKSQCCYKLPLTFSQDTTLTTTTSMSITSSSLHTIPNRSTYQTDMRNIDESMPLSPWLNNILESPIVNHSQSCNLYSLGTSNQSLAYENQPSMQDSIRTAEVSQIYSVTEISRSDYTSDSLTCIEIGSSGAQIQIRTQDLLSLKPPANIDPKLSPSDQPDSTSDTSVSSETQLSAHGFLSSIRPELPPKSRASRAKNRKEPLRTQCNCPNCIDGGNKLRNMYGKLVHFCYIPSCKKIFTATGHLQRHMEWHKSHKGFVCPICDKTLTRKDSVTRHVKIVHKNVMPNVSKDGSINTQNSPDVVVVPISLPQISIPDNYNNQSSEITSQTTSETHASISVVSSETNATVQTPTNKYDMPILDAEESFETNMPVTIPIRISDIQISIPTEPLETNISVPTLASIEKNLESPAHISPSGCETIYNQFALQNSSVVPLQAHSLKDSLSDLLIFRPQNTGQKICNPNNGSKTIGPDHKLEYPCHFPDCDKVFNQKRSLKRHLILHNGKSNFICKYCDKKFTRKDTLFSHVSRHENTMGNEINNNNDDDNKITKKKFACQIVGCDKIYSSNTHLNKHLKHHHGIQPYVCTWSSCDEKFYQELEFQKHMKKHTAEKNLVCSYCSKKCASDTKLKAHIYRIHENPIRK